MTHKKRAKKYRQHLESECVVGENCSGPLDPDHFKTLGSGGTDDPENIFTFCRTHHVEKGVIGSTTFANKYSKVKHMTDFETMPIGTKERLKELEKRNKSLELSVRLYKGMNNFLNQELKEARSLVIEIDQYKMTAEIQWVEEFKNLDEDMKDE